MDGLIRDYRSADAAAVNALAVEAFEEYRDFYSDWSAFSEGLKATASLARDGELIVAEAGGRVVGAVAYIGPNRPKSSFFEPQWSIMRMLVVSPDARGRGIGRGLAEECIARARRDRASQFALHTASIMAVARPMYERMGFRFLRDAPNIFGVPYAIYVMRLDA